ncbi:tyrosine-protein phosphatase [Glutamicibacter sp.]|uniref:tyrosine-protein phosphatase n=1 Tax=Glutamicibacter sp. TaxID=1931995 RepID=UPI0028BD8296|nr:tyrosine-protein phosphatase [Glutamicibacter sp.]
MTHALEYRKQDIDMHWDGAVNARLICGRFYRMGRREWLTDRGWEQLRAAGIATVIDLRNPGEIKRREFDPEITGDAAAGIDIVNLPLEEAGNERFEAVAVPYMNHTGMYRLVCEEFGENLRGVFEHLAQASGASVVHCSAGRDRSGLVATLLLDLAGRREDIALHDELAVRGINEWHRVSPRKHPYEVHRSEAELQRAITERAQGLEEFMAWVGSAEEYLRSVGMDAAVVRKLKSLTSSETI